MIGHAFEPLQLVNRPERKLHLHQMLRFINHHRFHLQALECILDRFTHVQLLCRIDLFSSCSWGQSQLHESIFHRSMSRSELKTWR
jgi:hypothetical protein